MPKRLAPDLSSTPSLAPGTRPKVTVTSTPPGGTKAVAVFMGSSGGVPSELGLSRRRLSAAGFSGAIGEALPIPSDGGPTMFAVGIGALAEVDTTAMRNAAAAFARAAGSHSQLAVSLADLEGDVAAAVQAVVEGVSLARYTYNPLRSDPKGTTVGSLTVVVSREQVAEAREGAARGQAFAAATALARDLAQHASQPSERVTARRHRGRDRGTYRPRRRGVRQGRAHRARVRWPARRELRQRPAAADDQAHATARQPSRRRRLAFVGKGIMYDSGGISLKPGDAVHAQMKNDMSGAAAVLAAMAELSETRVPPRRSPAT